MGLTQDVELEFGTENRLVEYGRYIKSMERDRFSFRDLESLMPHEGEVIEADLERMAEEDAEGEPLLEEHRYDGFKMPNEYSPTSRFDEYLEQELEIGGIVDSLQSTIPDPGAGHNYAISD